MTLKEINDFITESGRVQLKTPYQISEEIKTAEWLFKDYKEKCVELYTLRRINYENRWKEIGGEN